MAMRKSVSLLSAAPSVVLLPERVRVISLWHSWAALVAGGFKTIETRRWDWPYEPGWLAIHAAKRADGDVPGRLPFPHPANVPPVEPGALCALVWVAGSGRLQPEHATRAYVYWRGLFAWFLEDVRRLKPVKMRGPQKFSSVPREAVLEALGRAA